MQNQTGINFNDRFRSSIENSTDENVQEEQKTQVLQATI